MTPAQFEDERLRLKAERIRTNVHRRLGELETRRAGGLVNGFAPGWSDADWVAPQLKRALRRVAASAHRRGDAYLTTVNDVPLCVLGSGRLAVYDKGAK
jgi:hypothetical protein